MWRHTLSKIILIPRLTHMVIGMAAFLLVLRIGAVAEQAAKGSDPVASKESPKAEEPKKEEFKKEEIKKEEPKKEETKNEDPKKVESKTGEDASERPIKEAKDVAQEGEKEDLVKIDPLLLDESQINTLMSLAERRKAIEKEEVEMKKRKALIALSEKKVTDQLNKLQKVKDYIDHNKPVGMASPEENTKKMVKVYEGMKPQAAAQIFNKMRIETLIQVVQGMNQKKVASILAIMEPDRVRELTIRMTSIGVPIIDAHMKK